MLRINDTRVCVIEATGPMRPVMSHRRRNLRDGIALVFLLLVFCFAWASWSHAWEVGAHHAWIDIPVGIGTAVPIAEGLDIVTPRGLPALRLASGVNHQNHQWFDTPGGRWIIGSDYGTFVIMHDQQWGEGDPFGLVAMFTKDGASIFGEGNRRVTPLTLHSRVKNAQEGQVSRVLALEHSLVDGATARPGIGVGQAFYVQSGFGETRQVAAIDAVLTDPTGDATQADLVFSTNRHPSPSGGPDERLRVTSRNQLILHDRWGVGCTAITTFRGVLRSRRVPCPE